MEKGLRRQDMLKEKVQLLQDMRDTQKDLELFPKVRLPIPRGWKLRHWDIFHTQKEN
jgi:hypothetical protein